jgi:hypothetical protein
MKREVKYLLNKSLDSFILSIENFNRPWDTGRNEIVLILLDRSFELLLKASIVHKGGKIREPRAKETIGFEKCIRKCLSDADLKYISEDQALTLQNINSLRDAAQHYLLDISEQQLYLFTQAGVTLFGKILFKIFGKDIKNILPERIIPISSQPPKTFENLMRTDFKEIQQLVQPGTRKMLKAKAKIRSLAIIEDSLSGIRSQPSEYELEKRLRKVREGKKWTEIFPGISSLKLNTEGTGLNISIRISKKEGDPVKLVPEDTPGATVIALKRVNELGFYSLGLSELAKKLKLTQPKTLAVIDKFGIQENEDYFKIIRIGKTVYKRYSKKALDYLKKKIKNLDVKNIWREYYAKRRKK